MSSVNYDWRKENSIFEYITLKEFHVKYVKKDNKTCLIFNQDEMNSKNGIKSKYQELKTFIWIFVIMSILIFTIIL
jgi:hypothetical protein